jgi:hypothetical protein
LLSAEGLSLFYDRKEATEVLNWLRYASTLTQKMKGRAIGLNPEIRQAALHWFRKKDPAGAQIALNRGERFTDFQARIPSENERRMLLFLSHFLFFDNEVLKVVTGDNSQKYMDFVKSRPEWFVEGDHNIQMLPEYRDLCQRFIESVGAGAIDQETKQRISACWEQKRQRNAQSKDQHLSKQAKFREELASVDSQVESLKSAHEKILAPAAESIAVASKGKKRRQVKIGTSVGFLGLGVVVLALSLGLRDLFSSYHAAAGIFLILAGFFWPVVTIEAPSPVVPSGMDEFAVETQLRVLQFRLNGLASRRAKLREELGNVHRETCALEEKLDEPYLLEN